MTNTTFSPIAARFAWKEYRTLRGMSVAVVGLGIFAQVVELIFSPPGSNIPAMMFGTGLATAVLYSIGATSILFAVEHEDETYQFLGILPVRWLPMFTSKLAMATLGAVTTIVVLSLTGWASSHWLSRGAAYWPPLGDTPQLLAVLGIGILEAARLGHAVFAPHPPTAGRGLTYNLCGDAYRPICRQCRCRDSRRRGPPAGLRKRNSSPRWHRCRRARTLLPLGNSLADNGTPFIPHLRVDELPKSDRSLTDRCTHQWRYAPFHLTPQHAGQTAMAELAILVENVAVALNYRPIPDNLHTRNRRRRRPSRVWWSCCRRGSRCSFQHSTARWRSAPTSDAPATAISPNTPRDRGMSGSRGTSSGSDRYWRYC